MTSFFDKIWSGTLHNITILLAKLIIMQYIYIYIEPRSTSSLFHIYIYIYISY